MKLETIIKALTKIQKSRNWDVSLRKDGIKRVTVEYNDDINFVFEDKVEIEKDNILKQGPTIENKQIDA